MTAVVTASAFALASCSNEEAHDGSIRGMADQVARQDATYATYFSVERFLSGIGHEVSDDDALSDVLIDERPDLTVGRPFAAALATGEQWGRVIELAETDAIYDQPDGPAALLLGEFDTATIADRIEQLPNGEVTTDDSSSSWTVLQYTADPLADGGEFGLGRDGTLAVSGDRMIVAGSTTHPETVT